jgi:hypothetical protein
VCETACKASPSSLPRSQPESQLLVVWASGVAELLTASVGLIGGISVHITSLVEPLLRSGLLSLVADSWSTSKHLPWHGLIDIPRLAHGRCLPSPLELSVWLNSDLLLLLEHWLLELLLWWECTLWSHLASTSSILSLATILSGLSLLELEATSAVWCSWGSTSELATSGSVALVITTEPLL